MAVKNQAPPMFKASAIDASKYTHPWMTPLPAGRARAYDLLYKGTTVVLFAFGLYTCLEVGRGSWYVFKANHYPAEQAEAVGAMSLPWCMCGVCACCPCSMHALVLLTAATVTGHAMSIAWLVQHTAVRMLCAVSLPYVDLVVHCARLHVRCHAQDLKASSLASK